MQILIIILILTSGILCGRLLRSRVYGNIGRITSVLICILLFIIGAEVGNNENIIQNLHSLGLEALIITLGGLSGCMLSALLLWKRVREDERGNAE